MARLFSSRHFLFVAALGLIAVGAVWVVLYSTPQGLVLSDDSIAYIAGARSILGGNGYREAWLASNQPVTHFPPGFSTVLALLGLSGLDPLRGTRFINSILFGANAFLLGIIGWRMTRSHIAGVTLALLFTVNASMFNAHNVAMSEPLYIFFSLASFLTFSQYFEIYSRVQTQNPNTKNNLWLIATGILVSFAYLTRYAGLALLVTFLFALILLHNTWRLRLSSSLIFIASTIPFLLGWAVRNKTVADNATNRTLVWHPLSIENIETGIYNLSEFLVPVESWRQALVKSPNLFAFIVSFITLTLLIWVVYRGLRKFFKPATELPEVLSFTSGLYIFGYMASIVSSMLLFDASTKFKLRILSPVYVSLLVLLVLFGCWLWQKRSKFLRGLVVIAAVFIVELSLSDTALFVERLHKGGQGYTSFQWYDSEAMAFLRELPKDTRIYTNEPGPVYLYTDRPAYVLPNLIDPVTLLPREGYTEGVSALQEDVLSGKAVLAIFNFGSESENVQTIYAQISQGLYLAHASSGDKIFTSLP